MTKLTITSPSAYNISGHVYYLENNEIVEKTVEWEQGLTVDVPTGILCGLELTGMEMISPANETGCTIELLDEAYDGNNTKWYALLPTGETATFDYASN